MERELTTKEKREIKQLIIGQCANYDKEVGCLLLDSECPMLLKCHNKCICKYFGTAVLPNNSTLEAVFETGTIKKCKNCGKAFRARGRKLYCSEKCAKTIAKKRSKLAMRKTREN